MNVYTNHSNITTTCLAHTVYALRAMNAFTLIHNSNYISCKYGTVCIHALYIRYGVKNPMRIHTGCVSVVNRIHYLYVDYLSLYVTLHSVVCYVRKGAGVYNYL